MNLFDDFEKNQFARFSIHLKSGAKNYFWDVMKSPYEDKVLSVNETTDFVKITTVSCVVIIRKSEIESICYISKSVEEEEI